MTGVSSPTRQGVRVAVTVPGPVVFRWREAEAALGRKFGPESLAGLSVPAGGMNEDIHGSREYRANLVSVLAKRAVAQIAGR